MELRRVHRVDGVELQWDEWGDGEPFVLCHGFSGSSHDFALQVGALAEGRRVITLDHRGHGRSTKVGRTDGYSVGRLAADLVSFLDEEVGEPVDLLGHSMGGRIALEVVLARPDLVRSLVLMDTSAWSFEPADVERAALIRAFLPELDPAEGLPDIADPTSPEEALIAAATPTEWQARKLEEAAGFDPYALKALGIELLLGDAISVRDRLPEISCPVTVIAGEHDHPFVDQAADLAAEVADGRVVVIPGAYHSPQLTEPALWRAAVDAHLALFSAAIAHNESVRRTSAGS
jgi:pimeloyl-ACP methyl ester carboxylesterase